MDVSLNASGQISGIGAPTLVWARFIHRLGFHSVIVGVSEQPSGLIETVALCFLCGHHFDRLRPTAAEVAYLLPGGRPFAPEASPRHARRRGGPRAKRGRRQA